MAKILGDIRVFLGLRSGSELAWFGLNRCNNKVLLLLSRWDVPLPNHNARICASRGNAGSERFALNRRNVTS